MNTLRFGVVGLSHGAQHVLSLSRNPRAEVAAVCDPDPARHKRLAEALPPGTPAPDRVPSLEDMLRRADLEAVVLAVPTPLHARMAVLALEAGKHVLLEKPMALTLEEADSVCRAAETSGRVFSVAYCVRSSGLHRLCLESIARGLIGRVVLVWYRQFCVETGETWRLRREQGGGKLFDCACHYLDLMSAWAGARPVRVAAFGNPPGERGPNPDRMPEVAAIALEYENGVKGTYSLSSVTPGDNQAAFGIVGTRGRIDGDPWLPEQAGSLTIYAEGNRYRQVIEMNGQSNSRGHLGFDEQHDDFLDAVLHGRPPACPAADGREILRLMLAIERSLSEGRVIGLD